MTEIKGDLIRHLRRDARKSLSEVSRETGIPVTTLHDTLRRHEQRGIIKKHTSILDYHKLGYFARAHIVVRTEPHDRAKVFEFLRNHESMNNLIEVNNGFDYLMEGIFRNRAEIRLLTEHLRKEFKLQEIVVYPHIGTVCEEEFMTEIDNKS